MTVTAMQDGKIVLKKEDRKYYTAEKDPEILEFGEASYITLEGKGEPGGELFQSHINVLFTLAYQLKNAYKAMGHDFSMSSLEALWWAKSGKITEEAPPEEWTWKVMIRVPDYVSPDEVQKARNKSMEKKGMPALQLVEHEKMSEGKCAQILHVGPYEKEGETYGKLMKFISEEGLEINGLFHEIYLSDPSRTPPEKYRTIIRLPVK